MQIWGITHDFATHIANINLQYNQRRLIVTYLAMFFPFNLPCQQFNQFNISLEIFQDPLKIPKLAKY